MTKNLILWPQIFSWVLTLPDHRHCHKLLSYAILGKLIMKTQENGEKPHFGHDLGPLGPYTGSQFFFLSFFFFFQASSVTRYHGQLSSCTILEKANNLILRKFSDRRTDGPADRQARGISLDAVRLTTSVQYFPPENILLLQPP